MIRVGLTGGIGSGKSVVAGIFRALGVPVLDADSLAARIMRESAPVRDAIARLFGPEVFRGAELDRKAVAGIVFADPGKLEALNNIVHPPVITAGEEWLQAQQAPYVVKEAAILFESGSAAGLDLVVGVSAPRELRISRAMRRDGVLRERVEARMARQMDEEEKMRRCGRVLVNDGQRMLLPQVLALHADLLKLSANA